MLEYLALVRSSTDEIAVQRICEVEARLPASSYWQQVHDDGILRLLCRSRVKNPVAQHAGALIVGDWFSEMPHLETGSSGAVDAADADLAFPPQGWGDYVAFRCDPHPRRVCIYVEPTAQLPCLHVDAGRIQIFGSCIATLRHLMPQRFVARTDFLHNHLLGWSGTAQRLPLVGVNSIMPGEVVELDLTTSRSLWTRRPHWAPRMFGTRAAAITDPQLAKRALHQVVRQCTAQWIARTPEPMMRLSGGLDSSIVFGCLACAEPRSLRAYTYFDPRGHSDEPHWAQLAASHHAIECHAVPFRPEEVRLDTISHLQPTLAPVSILPYLQRATVEAAFAEGHGVDTVFSGQGGDSNFCRDSIDLITLDHIERVGLNPTVLSLCARVATYTGQSFWEVIAATVRHDATFPLDDAVATAQRELSALVDPEIRHAPRQALPQHPWLATALPPTWRRRLAVLLSPGEYYNIAASDTTERPRTIAPLLSRPVVETCLRIPSWLHFLNGIERGLARQAFEDEVPLAILRRCCKDRGGDFFRRLMILNRSFVREFLLDGVLVRDRWLSKPAIESALNEHNGPSRIGVVELLNHLSTEAWVRHWS